MSVSRIVRHFEGVGKIPVELPDVLEQVKRFLPHEEIEIRGVDVPVNRLRGQIYRYKKTPEDGSALTDTRCSLIQYSTRLPVFMQRLVACKELLHALDSDPILTSDMKKLLNLAQHVAERKFPNPSNGNSVDVFIDELTKYKAIAVLFPYSFREFCEDVNCLDSSAISKIVEIPEEYVKLVLSPHWPVLRQTFLAFD